MTHTRPDNQQSRARASPRSRQAVPLPGAVSSACTQRASWAAEGLEQRRRLSAPSVAASWTSGGGLGETRLGLCPTPRRGCNCGMLLPGPRPGPGPPQSSLSSGRLTIAAVSELAVLGNLQFGGVGGGDAVTGLHAVPLFQLRQGAHEAGVGGVQGGDALLLWTERTCHGLQEGEALCAYQCWDRREVAGRRFRAGPAPTGRHLLKSAFLTTSPPPRPFPVRDRAAPGCHPSATGALRQVPCARDGATQCHSSRSACAVYGLSKAWP